jgi:hypothetical protein
VGGSEAKKGPASILFRHIFYGVFELPSPRNAQKRDKNREKSVLDLFVDLFVTRDKTKNRGDTGIATFVDFFGEIFRHGVFVKICLWCF